LLHRAIDPALAPQALRDLDWIEDASFDRMLEKVLNALLTDKDDWKQAGRWQRLSHEWDKNREQHSGLLLHGKELRKAEDWLRRAERWRLEGSNKKPQPLGLHIEFIRGSRRAANRFLLASIGALLLLIGFTGGGAFLWLSPPDPTRVTNAENEGSGSLRWVIANTRSGSTITFAPNLVGRTINLKNGDLHIIQQKLTIQGPATGHITIRESEASIVVDMFASVTISDLAFQGNAKNQGGLFQNKGTLTLKNGSVSGNSFPDGDGHIFNGGIVNEGTLTILHSPLSVFILV
jgi:hypothetical protein